MTKQDKINAACPLGRAGVVRAPVAAPATFTACPECDGTGFFVSGAFHPDDPRCEATWDCENCDGTGEVEDFDDCEWLLSKPDGWERVEL